MKKLLPTTVLFLLIFILLSGCMGQSATQPTHQSSGGSVAVSEPVTSVPTTCHTTTVYRGGTNRSGFTDIPWIQATPSTSGIRGYLFFAASGASSHYRFLHTGGSYPDGGVTKVLWEITNPQASDTIEIVGSKLSGGSELFRQSFPEASSPAGDYPSAVNVPTAGCWRLELKSGTLTASVVFWVIGS